MVGPLYWGKKKIFDSKGFLRPEDKRDMFIHHYEIEKDSFFKVKPLYEALHNLLDADGWQDPRGGDNFEDLYWERHGADGSKDFHFWWRVIKQPRYNNNYIRYAMKIDFQAPKSKPAEISYNGKKAKGEKADLVIRFWFWVQFDWENKLKDSIFGSFGEAVRTKLMKKELESHQKWLYNYGEKLRGFVKDYLDIEEAGERPRLFHPEGGYKNQF